MEVSDDGKLKVSYSRKEAERAFNLICELMKRENIAVIDGIAACQSIIDNYVKVVQLAQMPVAPGLPQ